MYEPSDEEKVSEEDYKVNVEMNEENHSENSKEVEFVDKSKEEFTPLDDTSVKMSGSEVHTEIDHFEKRKKFNPDEHKYPLEYHKYLKIRETVIENLIKKKVNCFGNFGISLFLGRENHSFYKILAAI